MIRLALASILIVWPLVAEVRWTAPFSVSAGIDRGLLVGDRSVGDSLLQVAAPGISLNHKSPRLDLALTQQSAAHVFQRNRDLDYWRHQAGFRLEYQASPRWSLGLGDDFLSTHDVTADMPEGLLLLPRGPFRMNSFHSTASFQASEVQTLTFRGSNTITQAHLGGALGGAFDQMASAATVSLSRMLSPKHRLTPSYSLLHLRPLRSPAGGGEATGAGIFHNADVGFGYTPSPGWTFELGGGAIAGPAVSYTVTGRVERSGRRAMVSGGYARSLSYFGAPATATAAGVAAAGVLPVVVFDTGTFLLRALLTPRLRATLHSFAFRASGLADGAAPATGVVGRAEFEYQWTRHVSTFIRGESFNQNRNDFAGQPLARQRVMGGLRIYLDPPDESWPGRIQPSSGPMREK